jgi:uncharacterized protein YacL
MMEDRTHSASNLKPYSYVRTMGAYRPHFEGIPEEYFPLTACEVIGYIGLMIGFLFWVTEKGLNDYIIVWSIVFLVFTVFLIIAFYVGGRSRIREEKRLIVEQQLRQEKMKRQIKPKDPYTT